MSDGVKTECVVIKVACDPKMDNDTLNMVVEKAYQKLDIVMDKWNNSYHNDFSGGKMRRDRGIDLETYVIYIIHLFKDLCQIDVKAVKGDYDKKSLNITHNNKTINKKHQVDVHVYKNNNFIAVIECKSYLDSCYYTRACNDFKLFEKFGYKVSNLILSLENSLSDETKIFIDILNDNICHNVFYLLDGKRSSTKPVYETKFRKSINKQKLSQFIVKLFNIIHA